MRKTKKELKVFCCCCCVSVCFEKNRERGEKNLKLGERRKRQKFCGKKKIQKGKKVDDERISKKQL